MCKHFWSSGFCQLNMRYIDDRAIGTKTQTVRSFEVCRVCAAQASWVNTARVNHCSLGFSLRTVCSYWQAPFTNVSRVILLRRRGPSWWQGSRRTSWKRCWTTQRGYAEPLRPDGGRRFLFFFFSLFVFSNKKGMIFYTFFFFFPLAKEKNVVTEMHDSSPQTIEWE